MPDVASDWALIICSNALHCDAAKAAIRSTRSRGAPNAARAASKSACVTSPLSCPLPPFPLPRIWGPSPPLVTPADLQAARVAKLSPPVPTSTPTPSCAQADDLGRPALGDSEQYSADKVVPSNSSWLKRSDKRTDAVRPMGDAFAEVGEKVDRCPKIRAALARR